MLQDRLGLRVGTPQGLHQDCDAVAYESRRQQHVKECGRHQQRRQGRQRNKAVQQITTRRWPQGRDDIGKPGNWRHKGGADRLHPS